MIGGFEPANSGSHFEMSSSSLIAPRSTKVMSVAAVNHLVDDATPIGLAPDMPPMACSWITEPSAATILTMPLDNPADRTRSSSNASVESNVPGAKTLRTAAVVVVVAATVVEGRTDVDVTTGPVGSVALLDDPDDEQPATSNTNATSATTRRDHKKDDNSGDGAWVSERVRRAGSRRTRSPM